MTRPSLQLLHRNATPEALAVFRVMIFGLWFFKVLLEPLSSLSLLPQSIFYPTGLLMKFLPDGMIAFLLTEPAMIALKYLLLVSLFLVIINRWTLPASAVSAVLLTWYQCVIRGYGFINHSEIAILYAVYIFVLFQWADKLAGEKKGPVSSAQLTLIISALALCFVYALTGIHRVVYGGWGVFTSGNMLHWVLWDSNATDFTWRFDSFVLQNLWVQRLLDVGFPVSTAFEISAPFCLVFPPYRYVFLMFMVPFHLMCLVFMHVMFFENIWMYFLLFNFSGWLKPNKG